MDETTLLLTRMEDFARHAEKTGAAHSKFLTPSEGAKVQTAYAARRDISFRLEGGFEGAERKVGIFTQPNWGVCNAEDVLSGLRLTFRIQDIVRHQDVMGAILALGLSRDVMGDIDVAPGIATLVCLSSMADFIVRELQKVGRVGIAATAIPLSQLPVLSPALAEKMDSVASLRLDAVLAAAFNLSRTGAAEAIRTGRVQLAHEECLNPTKIVHPGDIFALRGKGRAKLLSAEGFSRKGRQRIVLGFFI